MRKLFSTIILAFSLSTAFTQAEKANYKIVADDFETQYNKSNYDSIFAMFSPEMQKALPIAQTNQFLAGLKTQAGKITKRQFLKYKNGTYASYKTNFERA